MEECGGLPLVLEVIGNYLWDQKEVCVWSEALERLQKPDSLDRSADENVVWKKLKVSFERLGKLEKQLFLDVATFDLYPTCKTHYDVEIFRSAWETEGNRDIGIAIKNLEQRSFLSVEVRFPDYIVHVHRPGDTLKGFSIHKQMRAMAAWISGPVEENLEDRRSIWQLPNVIELLTNCDKVSRPRTEVLSISVERKTYAVAGHQLEKIKSLQWRSLGSLKVLRLLRISDMHMLGVDKLKFPAKLALLHMENCTRERQKGNRWFPWSRLSSWPLCDENIEELGALSVLIFENCSFVQLPQNFHMLRCLKILRIHNSGKSMGALPENIGLLSTLKHLSLNVPLKRLPNSLLELRSLQSLVLSGIHLQAWPVPITIDPCCHLRALTELHLVHLPALVELPDTFGGLASLNNLTIECCSALQKLPEGFGALLELRTLFIKDCSKFEQICESFFNLSKLGELDLDRLPKLRTLPATIGDLSSLEEMYVRSCPAIKELPGSFANLPSIRHFSIDHCHALESLWPDNKYDSVNQGLKKLQSFSVYSCSRLQCLPKSLELKSLRYSVKNCREFKLDTDQLRHRPESLFSVDFTNTSVYG
ncbi:hypothetical protein R1sor_005969 [Riccia sorocarpa]|uniref:Disease resistance protein At4g27190-like leucine-rich repeats domain-containing protein n=1 Tax=Riccia sorocarpa TaxID=122646 RepID=A0ABD3HLL9_9MARC